MIMASPIRPQRSATVLGILAILIWGSTIPCARSLIEQLGTLTAAASIYLLAGSVGFLYLAVAAGRIRGLLRVPRRHLAGRGILFVVYMVCLYLAIGTASSRQQVVEVGVINYLWPGLTLVLSVPILRNKPRLTLLPGIVIALGGVTLATMGTEAFSWQRAIENLQLHWLPYVLALIAAFCWAVYNNLTRRWAEWERTTAVPVFLLATGLVLAGLRGLFGESSQWSLPTVVELLYVAIFPAFAAYLFWDIAMRRGSLIFVVSLSHLIPLLSTVLTCLYLRVRPGPSLWIACGLVVVGAVICRLSIVPGRASVGGV